MRTRKKNDRMLIPGLMLLLIFASGSPLLLAADTNAEQADWSTLPTQTFDVIVVGGSSSGVGAAIGAARLGASVALINVTPVLGGMLANGIGNTDSFADESLGGVFHEFTELVKAHYQPLMGTDPLFRQHISRYLPPALKGEGAHTKGPTDASAVLDPDQGGRWEPHVADEILKRMVSQYPKIEVFYGRFPTQVVREREKVIGVVTYAATEPNAYAPAKPGTGIVFYGDVTIDATPEGDIAAWAGAPYRVGREPRSPLEPHAGSIYYNDGTGEILPGSTGQQDNAVVSYGERITLKIYGDNDYRAHLLTAAPPHYDAGDYLHSSYSAREYLPNGKAEVNVYPFGSEIQEANWGWPEASREEREKLYRQYVDHAVGFLYFLQREKGMSHVGLSSDDYADNHNVPYELYVREARRIIGDYVMTEADINPAITGRGSIPPVKQDTIAVGFYPIDAKPAYKKTDLSLPDKGNGNMFITSTSVITATQIPYRSVVPRNVDGLLVAAAISSTHIAYSAIRLDPTWTVIGQATGVAAALASKGRVGVRAVPVDLIQRELLKQKCALMFYWDLPLDHPGFAAINWLSVQKVVQGYPDRLFRPDQPLTREELASLVVNGFRVWPSASNQHFSDVPSDAWDFRDIETLYDNQALTAFGVKPLWPQQRTSGYGETDALERFFPSKPTTWKELAEVIQSVRERRTVSPASEGQQGVTPPIQDPMAWVSQTLMQSMFGKPYAEQHFKPDDIVTRAEACALMASLLDETPPAPTAESAVVPEGAP